MSYNSTDTSSSHNNEMEGKVVDLRLIGCVQLIHIYIFIYMMYENGEHNVISKTRK